MVLLLPLLDLNLQQLVLPMVKLLYQILEIKLLTQSEPSFKKQNNYLMLNAVLLKLKGKLIQMLKPLKAWLVEIVRSYLLHNKGQSVKLLGLVPVVE